MTPLRKRMMEELQLRNLSPVIADTYLRAVKRFARYYNLSPEKLGAITCCLPGVLDFHAREKCFALKHWQRLLQHCETISGFPTENPH